MPEMNLSAYWAWVMPLAPLVAAALIALGLLFGKLTGEAGEKNVARVAQAGLVIALAALPISIWQRLSGHWPTQVADVEWLRSGGLRLTFTLSLDAFALAFAALILLCGLLALRFSANYLHRERGFARFFMLMSLFVASMQLIALGGDGLLVFVGWELAGLCSYLLIAYNFERDSAARNANRVLTTNRIGDASFLLGLFAAAYGLGGTDWYQLTHGGEGLLPGLIGISLMIAAWVKAGAFPFSAWVGRALEGPTPSSALFYGALLTHAGIFLLWRIAPLIDSVFALQLALMVIGVLTALYGFFGGLVQSDIKTALMFSTTGQLGLMILAAGLGAWDWLAWHMLAHLLWRTYQFLNTPSVLQHMHRAARPVPPWLTNKHRLYTACVQRFWLDNFADAVLTRPTQLLANEVRNFDENVVMRLLGLPTQVGAISSMADWEGRRQTRLNMPEGQQAPAVGVIGGFFERLASMLHWFEEHMVLRGGGEDLIAALRRLGRYALLIEQYLAQPRYLWLLILVTFVVII